MILGLSFMSELKVSIDLDQPKVTIGSNEIEFPRKRVEPLALPDKLLCEKGFTVS